MKIKEVWIRIKFYVFLSGLILISSVLIKHASTGIIYLIENYRYRGNAAVSVIPAYLSDTTTLQITLPDASTSFDRSTEKARDSVNYFDYQDTFYHQPARQTYTSLSARRSTDDDLLKVTFYNKAYHKFFVLILPDAGYKPSDLYFQVLPLKPIWFSVNKEDLTGPLYGSFDFPVPVFRFWGVTPLVYKGKNYDVTDNDFKYNATQYLSYIMPSKLFHRRFPGVQ